jgi:hypothetical protein
MTGPTVDKGARPGVDHRSLGRIAPWCTVSSNGMYAIKWDLVLL